MSTCWINNGELLPCVVQVCVWPGGRSSLPVLNWPEAAELVPQFVSRGQKDHTRCVWVQPVQHTAAGIDPTLGWLINGQVSLTSRHFFGFRTVDQAKQDISEEVTLEVTYFWTINRSNDESINHWLNIHGISSKTPIIQRLCSLCSASSSK